MAVGGHGGPSPPLRPSHSPLSLTLASIPHTRLYPSHPPLCLTLASISPHTHLYPSRAEVGGGEFPSAPGCASCGRAHARVRVRRRASGLRIRECARARWSARAAQRTRAVAGAYIPPNPKI